MYGSISSIDKVFQLGNGYSISTLAACRGLLCLGVLCLGLSGCASFDSRGDGLSAYETTNWREEIQLPDARGDFFGLSNTARQIEKSLDR